MVNGHMFHIVMACMSRADKTALSEIQYVSSAPGAKTLIFDLNLEAKTLNSDLTLKA